MDRRAPQPQEVQLKLGAFPEPMLTGWCGTNMAAWFLIHPECRKNALTLGCTQLGRSTISGFLCMDSFMPVVALLQIYLQSPALEYFGRLLCLLARLMMYTREGSEKICLRWWREVKTYQTRKALRSAAGFSAFLPCSCWEAFVMWSPTSSRAKPSPNSSGSEVWLAGTTLLCIFLKQTAASRCPWEGPENSWSLCACPKYVQLGKVRWVWEGLSPGKVLCGWNREWTMSWCCWNVSAGTATRNLLCCLSWCLHERKITFPSKTAGFVAWQGAAPYTDRPIKGFFCQLS